MKLVNVDLKYILLILLISVFFTFDLFMGIGRSANGDGLIHTVVPTLFAKAIVEGNFPVGWVDGFANYGLPLGTVSQQLTTYATAFVTIFSHNPVLGFNLVTFFGVFLSSVFFYIFLRIYFAPLYAFAGIFLFTFTPYRVLNVYLRGALPEFFASVFFPLLLLASYLIIVKKNVYGIYLFIFSFALLTLTHPFMDIVVMFVLIPYIIFLLITTSRLQVRPLLSSIGIFIFSLLFGILLTSYYTLPLLEEIKYFYYGQSHNHLTPNNFLTLQNFLIYQYAYFTKLDIFNRGFIVNVGAIESIVFLIGICFLAYRIVTKKTFKYASIIDFAIISGIFLLFMMLPVSNFLYMKISLLSNIQFPWRMLSAFIFIPPILFSYFLTKLDKKIVVVLSIIIISFFAFPQLYGKNYTLYPSTFYDFTPLNLDAVVMNTIWTGDSLTYPIAKTKASIIEGQGTIISQQVTNAKRIYTISAKDQVRLVDRTFYFPGWSVLIDGAPTDIQYQNPDYRGVITYLVPAGTHTVIVEYTDTKIRFLGKALTIFFAVLFFFLLLIRKPLENLFIRNTK